MPSPDLYRVGCFIHFLPGLAAGRHLAGAVNWHFYSVMHHSIPVAGSSVTSQTIKNVKPCGLPIYTR